MATRKPSYHLCAPRGWINDPCAPYFDKKTGVYHAFYQWVKDGTDWSHAIGWGHATSKDMMHWEHDEEPSLWPETGKYDSQGVYTGCILPGQPEMAVIYTSVNDKGPGAPYVWGQEGLAIARSMDGGKTWVKDEENNVKIDPPQNITGWRDPIVSSWKAVDEARSLSRPSTYAILSGGIESEGPTFFLYELDLASPHTSWKDLGVLIEPSARLKRPATKWTGDRGWNWECGGFFELDGASYLIFSSEGDWFEPFDGTPYVPKPPKWQLWFRGRIELGSDASPKFIIEQEGILDWGSYYAAQSFEEKPGGRRLFYGWNADDDLTSAGRAKQGWSGVFSLPREFHTQTIQGVTKALSTPLDSLPPFRVSASEKQGEYTVETLGFRPVPESSCARKQQYKIPSLEALQDPVQLFSSRSFELELTVDINDDCESFSVSVLNDVTVSFLPLAEMITIDKSKSTDDEGINTTMAQGAHTLFTTNQGGQEKLHLRIFVDDSLIEVYANERFALSTRVYSDEGKADVSVSAQGGVKVLECSSWEMGL